MNSKPTFLILSLALSAYAAEISSSYALLEKQGQFKPDLKTEPVDKTFKRDALDLDQHPVYKHQETRANMEPVKPTGPVVKDDRMLADQPLHRHAEVNQNMHQGMTGYEYVPSLDDVSYPDVQYAPGYGYPPANHASNRYDMYGNSLSADYVVPDTSPFSLMWSQVPDARTIVSYVSNLVSWTLGSFFLLFLGTLLTVGVCSYTDLCTITYNGFGPIHEEMRSYVTPDNLDKISTAAAFVKTAIDKYNEDSKIPSVSVKRRRRAILY